MKITFVNHASFILEYQDVKLICDPWIEGSVFDNSWSLLMPSKFKFEDYSTITHIWFSHEHPDHFFPPNIKMIPIEYRKQITVIYKETLEKKVLKYCIGLGFKNVIELPTFKWYNLTDKLSLNCIPWHDDSTLMIRTPELKILNTNDCLIEKKDEAEFIVSKVGKPDVLFTQFSYANYAGETREARRKMALNKYTQIKIQLTNFEPKYLIPFASFVWFSHEENYRMNDGINTIREAHDKIKAENPNLGLIIMKPGSEWEFGSAYENESVLTDYDKAYIEVETRERKKTNTVPEERLLEMGASYVKRLQDLPYLPILNIFHVVKPLLLEVADLNAKFKLTTKGFEKVAYDTPCDLSITSDALSFCFKFNYGFNTLAVNARFKVLNPNNIDRFSKFMSLSDAMNHGRTTTKEFLKGIQRRILRKRINGYE